jgi:plasmid rolling circle replication initiator protein Rep
LLLTKANNRQGISLYEALPGASLTSTISEVLELAQVSEKDKVWDDHRANADIVSRYYAGSDYNKYAVRISFCAELLYFKISVQGGLCLSSCHFCRVRYCPVCQWRRSCMWKAKAHQVLPKVVEAFPNHRWLFLTLTLKHFPMENLRETINHMNKSFTRLSQLKSFPGKGWIKSLEITRGRDGMPHPHFHVLILVNCSYFAGHSYISSRKWSELWGNSLRADYEPITDVRAIKEDEDVCKIIPEILKYQTKESDLTADRDWLIELTKQTHNLRAVAVGGVLRPFMKELEEEPENLIGEGDEEVVSDILMGFRWRSRIKKYIHEGNYSAE